MPSPSLKRRNSAISSQVATLEKPHFIGRFSAYSLMEKLRGRYEWRREWDSNPRYSFPHTRFPSVRLKPLGHLSGRPSLETARSFLQAVAAGGRRNSANI